MMQPGCLDELSWRVVYPAVPTLLACDNAKQSTELSILVQVIPCDETPLQLRRPLVAL